MRKYMLAQEYKTGYEILECTKTGVAWQFDKWGDAEEQRRKIRVPGVFVVLVRVSERKARRKCRLI